MGRQQLFQRVSALTARHALKPSLRNPVQRRLASGEMPKLTGTADNAFNRERMAVKQHAAASSGTWSSNLTLLELKTNRSQDLWRKLSL